ncbi:heterokaryon incompatibility protein-domain-containing protein [Xylariaceae sp. AK1471]|nr:heterokaryon incompatibility protein-domain-containing protein [Xylariaceae sp. AK1471]
MRLIHTTTLHIHEFSGDSVRDYAILSHTWDEEECTLHDMSTLHIFDLRKRKGFEKIKYCCEQAVRDGLDWAWVDTCCIDKTSTAELSEAINSMFRWYSNAKICYAYLADVTNQQELASSRWFSRGWTLQELIAPKAIQFYSLAWTLLGSKSELQGMLQEITGIDAFVLSTGNFSNVCVARRMSWAAKRTTTRIEDLAYSLMGIFDVNMPLIYGEGEKAFVRLQQEILRVSDDQSLFAWGAPEVFRDMHGFLSSQIAHMNGLLANSPADFDSNYEILEVQDDRPPPLIHGNGVRVQYPVCMRGAYEFIILSCTVRHIARAYLGIPVKSWGDSFYARCGPLILIFPEDWMKAQAKILVVKGPFRDAISSQPGTFKIVRVPNRTRPRKHDHFVLDEVYCLPHARYTPSKHSIAYSPMHWGPLAVLFFVSSTTFVKKRQTLKGIFPLHCFAVVLGSFRYPWTGFVPILRDKHADADFHEIIRADNEMARYCMTKNQLKDRISRGKEADSFLPKIDGFDQLLSVWMGPFRGTRSVHRNLEISVNLDIKRIDLVDDAVFVSIDIYEISMVRSSSKLSFTHSKYTVPEEPTEDDRDAYHPDWLTVDQLEWFIDRVPWEPSK